MKDKKTDKRLLLPRDDFEEEASEGLGKLNREEAQEDLQELRNRLERRIRKPWMIWLAAAAAVMFILIASAVYISLFRGPRMPGIRMARNEEVIRDTVLIAMAEPIVRPDTILIVMAEPIIRAEVYAVRSEVLSAKVAEVAEEPPGKPAAVEVAVSGKTVVMAQEQAAYAVRAKRTASAVDKAALPSPVGGFDVFDVWIRNNIRYPVDAEPRVPRETVVTFKVAADSTVYDMKAESSPGDSFTREAFRLLREGPKWIPAVSDGKVVDEKVSVSIVFK